MAEHYVRNLGKVTENFWRTSALGKLRDERGIFGGGHAASLRLPAAVQRRGVHLQLVLVVHRVAEEDRHAHRIAFALHGAIRELLVLEEFLERRLRNRNGEFA